MSCMGRRFIDGLGGRVLVRLALMLIVCSVSRELNGAPVPVIQKQGSTHGFLVLEDENHKEIAVGDQINVVRGNTLKARLVFHFKDGSIDDETAVVQQGATFRLLTDHHVQSGPSFAKAVDVTIDVPKGQVSWVESSGKGKETKSQHVDMPADLVNGLLSLVVENFPAKTEEMDVSYLVVAPKPRVVKFNVKRDGEDRVTFGARSRKAERFNIHVSLGGVAGAVAPLLGKQPPDLKMWTLGELPVFIRMVGPLYMDGPIWTIAWAAPKWVGGEQQQ